MIAVGGWTFSILFAAIFFALREWMKRSEAAKAKEVRWPRAERARNTNAHPSPTRTSNPTQARVVYLNGAYMDAKDARVSVDDRGFLFADGVYEVTRVAGEFIQCEGPHFDRLRNGLRQLQLDEGVVDKLPGIVRELVKRNHVAGDSFVYIQVTRGGESPRAHAWAGTAVKPTVYARITPFTFPKEEDFAVGKTATVEMDMRWQMCHLKTVSLLPNVLANNRAKEAGAYEALFSRFIDPQGMLGIVEASHSNVFAVLTAPDGTKRLVTPPLRNILPGVTRGQTLERGRRDVTLMAALAAVNVTDIVEGDIPLPAILNGACTELMVTASTSFVAPITSITNTPGGSLSGQQWVKWKVGNGEVGPVATALRAAWIRWWSEDKAAHERGPAAAPPAAAQAAAAAAPPAGALLPEAKKND